MQLSLSPFLIGLLVICLFRSYLLMSLPEEGENKPTEAKLQGYAAVLSIGSTRCKANLLGKNSGKYEDVIDTMAFVYIGISNPFYCAVRGMYMCFYIFMHVFQVRL